MGYRPSKVIGWGMKVPLADLDLSSVEAFHRGELSLKYTGATGLLNFMEVNELESLSYSSSDEAFAHADERDFLKNFIHIASEKYEEDFSEQEHLFLTFFPMSLSPLISNDSYDLLAEFKSRDTPFVYAEIERFNEGSLESLDSFSYGIDSAIYPSEYSVIHKAVDRTKASSFKLFTSSKEYVTMEPYRALRGNDPEHAELNAKISGFSSLEELQGSITLAPPVDIFALAAWSGLFKNVSSAFELSPHVVYYWS